MEYCFPPFAVRAKRQFEDNTTPVTRTSLPYVFKGKKDGRYPGGPLIFDAAGNLYGSGGGDVSCTKGNRWGCGNVFELQPLSGGKWKLIVLHTFSGGHDGDSPSGVISDGKGNFYGIAVTGGDLQCGGGYGCGVVFEVTP